MEYRSGRKPCRNGVNCYYLRNGDSKCWYDHPQEHLDIAARERETNSHTIKNSRYMVNPQDFRSPSLLQYPKNPTTYGVSEGYNRNTTRYYSSRPQNYERTGSYESSNRNPNNYRKSRNTNQISNQRTRHPQQQNRPTPNNPNSDRQRSRDLIKNPRPEQQEKNPKYTYHRIKYKKQNRTSPDYIPRPYGNQQRDNKENDHNRLNYSQVKPQKSEIKIKFSSEKVQKIQEWPQNDNHFNYQPYYKYQQPSQQLKDKLHELYPKQSSNINLIKSAYEANKQRENRVAQERIALTREQQRRRARELREWELRPSQARYFHGNQRLMEQNRRMIQENRIQQEERDRRNNQLPTMEELYGHVENFQSFGENVRFFADDYYGVDYQHLQLYGEYNMRNRLQHVEIEDQSLVTEENFHWFLRHCKLIDARKLTLEEANYFESCFCGDQFSDLVQSPQENMQKQGQMEMKQEMEIQKNKQKNKKKKDKHNCKESNQNHDEEKYMLLQLYCHQKHIYHKECAVKMLRKQLLDQDNVRQQSRCAYCRHDFRDHPVFSQHDPNYRSRFIPMPQIPSDQEELGLVIFVNWQYELSRLNDVRRDPLLRLQRFRNIVDMVNEREIQWAELLERRGERRRERRRQRRRQRERERQQQSESEMDESISGQQQGRQARRRLQLEQEERRQLYQSSSMNSSDLPEEQIRLYPIESQSSQSNPFSKHCQDNEQAQNINPEHDRQYWARIWEQKPSSNPFEKENSQISFMKKNSSQSSN